MPPISPVLNSDELDELQTFLKDWLRHTGRTQSDLRRALRANSIRMPVLVEELHRIHQLHGLAALAERLCGIDDRWQEEEGGAMGPAAGREDSLAQLDLLLEEIRQEQQKSA
jgi:hypothetical protein